MRQLKTILTLIFLLTSFTLSGQNIFQEKVDNLKNITDMCYICRDTIDTYGCGQSTFWTVVIEKEEIIPYLLDKLDDTTKTTAIVQNFGGQWTVADIAYSALREIIIDIPTFKLIGVPFDDNGCGYCTYWNHLRKDLTNRQNFKKNLNKWYEINKSKLVWIESNRVLTCDCSFKHPNQGHFEVKK